MLRPLLLTVVVVLVFISATPAQTTDVRIERLIGLAKVWNTVKYYHPYLADRKIDWDKALVDTIPKVNAAHTDDEYAAAVDGMLAVLDDPETRISRPETTASTPPVNRATGDPVTQTDGIIRIYLQGAQEALFDRTNKSQQIMPALNAMLPSAKGVIIDCRRSAPASSETDDAALIERSLYFMLPIFLAETVTLGRSRYRNHEGYAAQEGANYGGYHSTTVLAAPRFIAGTGQRSVPLTFIVNRYSVDEFSLWDALQLRHLANVVYEGETVPDFGLVTAPVSLPGNVTAKIRVSDLANDSGEAVFTPDRQTKVAPGDPAIAAALSLAASPQWVAAVRPHRTIAAQTDREEPYAAMSFPSTEFRLLALFRFWGVIDTFYPYRDLILDTWSTVLRRYIPKFESDKNALEYQTSVCQLATEIHDSHAFIRGTNILDDDLGNFVPPVVIRYIESKAVVTNVIDQRTGLKNGDVIEAIDGKSEGDIRARLQTILAASTPQAFLESAAFNLLRGKKDSVAHLSIRRGAGANIDVAVPRSLYRYDSKVFDAMDRTTPIVEILPSGFAYVDLARLEMDQVDDMFKKIAGTKGVIFDDRGYPRGTAWRITPRLTTKDQPPAALFSRPVVNAQTLTDPDFALSRFTFRQRLPRPVGDRYTGKVVVLIDARAISQSEHTCLFFETATDVTFIGTPTTGANGDVTNTVLPGGIYINFTGQSVQHIDGRQLQRVGIQPTIRAAPTIAGITAGRDEVLEAAVKYLKRTVK